MADDSNIFFFLHTHTKLSIYIDVEVRLDLNKVYYNMLAIDSLIRMTDIAKKIKNATQDAEAKLNTEEEHAEGKPSSETLNKAKVKVKDALT